MRRAHLAARRVHMAALLSLSLLLAACAASTDGDRTPSAPLALPAGWSQARPAAASAIDRYWWRRFGNAELSAFVERAGRESHDIAASAARVRQADALARASAAGLLPVLDLVASGGREARLGGRAAVDGTQYRLGFEASYEADVWGRQRAARDAGQWALQASRHDREAVRLTVLAATARAWIDAAAAQERVDVADLNLGAARRILAVVEARERAGAASALEVAQQRTLLAGQQRIASARIEQAHAARTMLAVLTGQPGLPGVATRSLSSIAAPLVEPGTPAELMTRRPDLARAEARLAEAQADVAVARAAMLPRLALSAFVGSGAGHWRRALDNPVYSLAASLAAPIFDGGRLSARRDAAEALREELLADYRQAIAAACADVELALGTAAALDDQLARQDEELAQARRALALSQSRFDAGSENLLVLLDAQRTLFAAQDNQVQLRGRRLQAVVDLYKALGGGWPDQATRSTDIDANLTGLEPRVLPGRGRPRGDAEADCRQARSPSTSRSRAQAKLVTFAVSLTREALEDLQRLEGFLIDKALERGDLDLPDRAMAAIRREFGILETNPFTCRIAFDDRLERELVIPLGATGYVALFHIISDREVVVSAIRHQREDDYH